MIRTVTLDKNQKPAKEQIEQIKEAAKREEIVFDESSPEYARNGKSIPFSREKSQYPKKNEYFMMALYHQSQQSRHAESQKSRLSALLLVH